MEKETQFFNQVDTLLAEIAEGRKVERSQILFLNNIIITASVMKGLNVELKDARIKLSLNIIFLNVARIK